MADLNEGFNATSTILSKLTSDAGKHYEDPKSHIHKSAAAASTHTWLAKLLPPSVTENIETRFHMGNYVIDRYTGEKSFEEMSIYVRLGMHLLYYGTAEEMALHWAKTQELLKAESEKMGRAYDDPSSVEHIEPFIKSFNLEPTLPEMKQPDPKKYETFNEFFAREIREEARPIADPHDELVVSSPADCRLTAYPTIDLATKYWIKGHGFTLEKLFGNLEMAQQFDGGSLVIARLAPQDYHRWHSPVSGEVLSVKEIPGTYYTVNPQAINEPGTLDVFCENRRSVMTIKRSSTGGTIAIVAVGAMLVGSIKYVPGVEVGAEVRRGQCLGAFYYGGSTVIVVYPKGEVEHDEDLVRNSTEHALETLMKVGWRTGCSG